MLECAGLLYANNARKRLWSTQGSCSTLTESLGIVHLVGAGPGHPGLITVAGLERLRAAQVVIYDGLVHHALLVQAPSAILVNVGRRADQNPMRQDEINQVLIDHARAGRSVVRLTDGDPFVFGGGGEEAEALFRAGIPFEVVPGVSSAIAVPAYAGIPVTHRALALAASPSSLAIARRIGRTRSIATGSERPARTRWFSSSASSRSPAIVENLVATGKCPDTPAAVIECGTFSRQRTVTGTIETIARIVAEANIRPPATLVVGDVVSLRENLRWFDLGDRRPLLGLRVLNTRSAEDGEELNRVLRELGAEPLSLPATRIAPPDNLAPLDIAIATIASGSAAAPGFDWIGFTSAHAVSAFMDRLFGTLPSGPDQPGTRNTWPRNLSCPGRRARSQESGLRGLVRLLEKR